MWKVGHQLSWPAEGAFDLWASSRIVGWYSPSLNELLSILHVAQKQGGFVELPWGKKNIRLHALPSRLLREHLQFRRRLYQTCAAHMSGPGASRQTNLAKVRACRSKSAADTEDRPSNLLTNLATAFHHVTNKDV